MRLISWKEVTSLNGDVVWSYYDDVNNEICDQVYIAYDIASGRLCEEYFPITTPEYEDCHDIFSTRDKFSVLKEGTVSTLETSGDVINREDDTQKVVVYSQEDINNWIDKLRSLDLREQVFGRNNSL